jgi:hypothetical protein
MVNSDELRISVHVRWWAKPVALFLFAVGAPPNRIAHFIANYGVVLAVIR